MSVVVWVETIRTYNHVLCAEECGLPGGANARNDGYHFNNMSMILAAAKLQTIHAKYIIAMTQDANSAFSQDQSVCNFCSTATRSQRRRIDVSPAYAATSLFRYANRPTYETSRNSSRSGRRGCCAPSQLDT